MRFESQVAGLLSHDAITITTMAADSLSQKVADLCDHVDQAVVFFEKRSLAIEEKVDLLNSWHQVLESRQAPVIASSCDTLCNVSEPTYCSMCHSALCHQVEVVPQLTSLELVDTLAQSKCISTTCEYEEVVDQGMDQQKSIAPTDESNPPYSLASKGTGGGSGGDMCPARTSTMISTTTTTIAALQAKLSKVVAALEAVQQPAFEVPHPEHGETENADVDPGVLSEISSSDVSDDGIHLYQVFDGSLDEVPWSAPTTTATSPWAISSTMAEKIAKDCLVVLRPLSVLDDLDGFWRVLDGALKIQTELERAGHAAIAEELTDNLHALLPVDGNESGSESEG